MPICVVIFSSVFILNILGAVFNVVTWLTLLVLDLALYLCGTFISILMTLLCSFPLLGLHGVALLVYPLFLPQFSFLAIFHFIGVTVKFLLLVGRKKDGF